MFCGTQYDPANAFEPSKHEAQETFGATEYTWDLSIFVWVPEEGF